MKEVKRGSSGLTQKEAIFQIIIRVAGDLYQPGISMKPVLWGQADHQYGRARSPNCPFDKIVREVYDGLTDGSIPSKLTSNYDRKEYASRIVHYWLRHDRRLNGGQPGTRMARHKRKQITLLERIKTDPTIIALRESLKAVATEDDRQEVQNYIKGRTFVLILETYEVSVQSIPENIRTELFMFSSEIESHFAKKTA